MELVNWHTDEGWYVHVIVKRTPKYLHVMNTSGMMTIKPVPLVSERKMTPVLFNGESYPVKRLVRHLKRMSKKYGATKAAKKAITRAVLRTHHPSIH